MTRIGKYVAAGGVLGTLVGVVLGTWYALTRDVHEMKDNEPDALPQAPALGKTGWRLVDALLPKLQALSSSTDIPLGLMVGWIGKESAGKLSSPWHGTGPGDTSMNERGYWQLTPEESQSLGLDHERLSTDSDYSLNAGVRLVRRYQAVVDSLNFAPAGSSMYWKSVKLAHSIGSGQIKKIVNAAKAAGQAGSWDQFEQFALGMIVSGPQPKKWFPFVDDVYRRGRAFGFGTEIAAPALVGCAHGFDILGVI